MNDANSQAPADKPVASVIAGAETKARIQKTVKWADQIRKNRSRHEKQWLVNTAFLYGQQHFEVDRKSSTSDLQSRIEWEFKRLSRKSKTQRTVNYILPLYRSVLSRLLLQKSHVRAKPETKRPEDEAAAKVANEVLEEFWEDVNKHNPYLRQEYCGMQQVLRKAYGYMLTMGSAYLKPYFNPSSYGKVLLNNEIIEGQVGNVEIEVVHGFDMFKDPLNQKIVQQKVLSVDQIALMYGQKLKPDDLNLSDVERQLINMLEGQQDETKFENGKRVYEEWQLPNAENPQGSFALMTQGEYLIEPQPLPAEVNRSLPYFDLRYFDVAMADHAQSMIEQLIPSQEDLNFTASKIAAYKKWFNGKVMVPKTCKLETKYDDEVGQIIKYDASQGSPTYQNGLNAPEMLYRDMERIRRDMEDIAATHDISLSKVPAGLKSGRAIENLSEIDNSQIGPTRLHIETQLGYLCDMVLDIMQHRYDENRLIAITGDEFAGEVKQFKGQSLAGNRRVKITLGSNLPMNTQAKQEFILMLADKEYISRDKALDLLEFGDVENVFVDVDGQAERKAIQMMLRGDVIEPQPWDDHGMRLKVLTQFLKSDQYLKLPPEMKQLFIQRRAKYQEFILAEQMAARGGAADEDTKQSTKDS